jgi:hypothetical protein
MSDTPELVVRRGLVHVVSAFDVGFSIDLARSKQLLSDLTEVASIKHKGHAPTYFQFDPPPLRMAKEIAPLEIGARRTAPSVDLTVYDFGGLSVSHTVPFAGTFEELIGLSCALVGSDQFVTDSRRHAADLLRVIESAVERANVAEATEEDYLIFVLEDVQGASNIEDFWTRHAPATARLLRSERDALSEQEIADAMATRVSFGRDDVALLDWNAALLVDREPEDVRLVLEFANLQLLEARFLDAALDRALDRSYELVSRQRRFGALGPSGSRADLARIGSFEVEGAILFERVGNALKLVGDQYLARVYRAASQRFRLAEWNAGILRKLETIESIYRKVQDRASGARAEALEWIIIALIAFEVFLSFWPGLRGG